MLKRRKDYAYLLWKLMNEDKKPMSKGIQDTKNSFRKLGNALPRRLRRMLYQDSRWISDAGTYTRITYNDNITIIYTKISVMKNFYLLKIGKSQSIHKMLYKSTRCTQTSERTQGREKDNKYSNAWIVLPTACFFLSGDASGFIS